MACSRWKENQQALGHYQGKTVDTKPGFQGQRNTRKCHSDLGMEVGSTERLLRGCYTTVCRKYLVETSVESRERKKEKRKGFGFVQICKAKRAPDLAIGQCK